MNYHNELLTTKVKSHQEGPLFDYPPMSDCATVEDSMPEIGKPGYLIFGCSGFLKIGEWLPEVEALDGTVGAFYVSEMTPYILNIINRIRGGVYYNPKTLFSLSKNVVSELYCKRDVNKLMKLING